MKKTTFTLLAVSALVFNGLNAGSGNVANDGFNFGVNTNSVTNEAGTPIPLGTGVVGVGFFDIDDMTIQNTIIANNDFSVLDTNFTQLAIDTVNGAGFGIDGLFNVGYTNSDAQAGNDLYLVIGTGATLSGSMEVLIVHFNEALKTGLGTTNGILADDAANLTIPDSVVWGGYNNSLQNPVGLGDAPAFNTAPVIPEPSTYVLMACGIAVVGLVVCRRSRKA